METRNIGAYLLAGLPGQPPAEIEASVLAVLEAGARPFISEYSPVPGSPMWGEAVRHARYDIENEPLFHNNSLLSCAHPELDTHAMTRIESLARDPFRVKDKGVRKDQG